MNYVLCEMSAGVSFSEVLCWLGLGCSACLDIYMYISDIFGKGYRLSSVNVGCYRSDGVDSSVYSIDRSFSVRCPQE